MMTMKELKLDPGQEQCLRDQAITTEQPGPVLRDFRMVLDFLGPRGVEAGGTYNLLPLSSLGELDRCLSRPLHLELKRPLLRSHPYLQGLHLQRETRRGAKAGSALGVVCRPNPERGTDGDMV